MSLKIKAQQRRLLGRRSQIHRGNTEAICIRVQWISDGSGARAKLLKPVRIPHRMTLPLENTLFLALRGFDVTKIDALTGKDALQDMLSRIYEQRSRKHQHGVLLQGEITYSLDAGNVNCSNAASTLFFSSDAPGQLSLQANASDPINIHCTEAPRVEENVIYFCAKDAKASDVIRTSRLQYTADNATVLSVPRTNEKHLYVRALGRALEVRVEGKTLKLRNAVVDGVVLNHDADTYKVTLPASLKSDVEAFCSDYSPIHNSGVKIVGDALHIPEREVLAPYYLLSHLKDVTQTQMSFF